VNNVKRETELYKPMCNWLNNYLKNKFPSFDIAVIDTHSQQLDRALLNVGITNELAIGVGIQIDVLGIARKGDDCKLFFIEAKKTPSTLKDLGQLLIYCKLINPTEAFLFTSADLGALDKLIRIHKREDLLDFGNGKQIKKIQICTWNLSTNSPNLLDIFPKI